MASNRRSSSPFARVGLWRNPFGELSAAERVAVAVVDVQPWAAYLNSTPAPPFTRRALQFVGDCGFGKTTHLLALEAHLSGAKRVYFPEDGPRPPLPRQTRVLIVDEAQRMGWWRRWQMLRHPGPLVIGTHQDLAHGLQASHFEVWTLDVSQPKMPAVIAAALNRRIEESMIDASGWDRCRIDEATAERLGCRFHSNLREIEQFLFEAFQAFVHERSPWPPVV